jgi:hypothetical protein
MGVEPSEKRRGRDRRRVDGRTRLENDRREPGEGDRFVREAKEAIMGRGWPGSIESIPTISGRDASGRSFGFRMQAEGARDREEACRQQDDLCETGFPQCAKHL